ncbi:MAG: hypothetical protein RJA98_3131 [Pseudomonadota bacterium]|jgi:putative addiction module component (TIGR02574 family)
MSALLDDLSQKAKGLAPEERAQLTQQLLASVEADTDPEAEVAWAHEIASRVVKYERGDATLIPAADVFEAARRLTR